jgi:hypothetical protein
VIGPGWMPSRPRPLGRVRRGPGAYTLGTFASSRRRRRPRPAGGVQIARDPGPQDCNTDFMLFDGFPAELPTATLVPGARHARHRVISGRLVQWLSTRWAWVRPRTVPMIAAFVGMLAVLGATRYLSEYARGDHRRVRVIYADKPRAHWLLNGTAHGRDASSPQPEQLRIVPVRPGSHDVTITLAQ